MLSRSRIVLFLLAVVVTGCATAKVTDTQQVASANTTRPSQIWVYDFVASPEDLAGPSDIADTDKADSQPATPPSAEELELARQLGAQIAQELVTRIQALGLSAQVAAQGASPQINDVVIKGHIISLEQGDQAKRVALGFGSGNAELKTVVDRYQVTAQGLRKLGSFTVDAGGSKGPGAAVPLALAIATHNPIGLIVSSGAKIYGEKSGNSKVEGRAAQTAEQIADQLKIEFKEQGWIA